MSNAVPGLLGLLAIFFDIGNRKLARLLYFPGLDAGPYAEVLGGLHHCVISVEPARWNEIVRRLGHSPRHGDAQRPNTAYPDCP